MVVIYPDINMFSNQSFLLIIIIIVLLQLRERRVRLRTLFIMPVVMSIITLPLVQSILFASLLNFGIIMLGLAIGLLVGFLIASFMVVKEDEEGYMVLRGSFVAVGFWILIIAIKIYGKDVLSTTGYFDLSVLTSVFLMMTLGAMISRRIFIYRKYREKMKEGNVEVSKV